MQTSWVHHIFYDICSRSQNLITLYFSRRIDTAQKQDAAAALLDLSTTVEHAAQPNNEMNKDESNQNKQTQTNVTSASIDKLEGELKSAKARVKKMSLEEDSFRGDDEKVKTYTGLPSFALLMALFTVIKPFLSAKRELSPFSQFLMTLMRLKHNTNVDLLAYQFGVAQSTISTTFENVIDVMFYKLVPSLIIWPTRDQIRKTLPTVFRAAFRTCTCIIDCFEIFIEKSSNLMAQNQTWSQYKHHNTMKYLIGISPQGTIMFLSKGYGGRTPDERVVKESGFLSKLLPGDLILADRGFDISELLATVFATLRIPAFTKDKKQLDPLEIEQTRQLANVRIHVERLIGLVREKFRMLKSTIPITMLAKSKDGYTQLDKIVAVCCALTSACPSIVPSD